MISAREDGNSYVGVNVEVENSAFKTQSECSSFSSVRRKRVPIRPTALFYSALHVR